MHWWLLYFTIKTNKVFLKLIPRCFLRIENSKTKYKVTKEVAHEILSYFNDFAYESGGALGIKDNIISMFYPLDNESKTGKDFSPSFDSLNKAADFFANHDAEFIGIIHSHPVSQFGSGTNRPSNEDIEFYKNFSKENKQFKKLVFPIITLKNEQKDIAWYILENNELYLLNITIV